MCPCGTWTLSENSLCAHVEQRHIVKIPYVPMWQHRHLVKYSLCAHVEQRHIVKYSLCAHVAT